MVFYPQLPISVKPFILIGTEKAKIFQDSKGTEANVSSCFNDIVMILMTFKANVLTVCALFNHDAKIFKTKALKTASANCFSQLVC